MEVVEPSLQISVGLVNIRVSSLAILKGDFFFSMNLNCTPKAAECSTGRRANGSTNVPIKEYQLGSLANKTKSL